MYADDTVLFWASSQAFKTSLSKESSTKNIKKLKVDFLVIVCLLMSQKLKPCFLGPSSGFLVQTLDMHIDRARGFTLTIALYYLEHSCEMIILRNKSHGEIIRVCMEYLRPLLGIKNTVKFLREPVYHEISEGETRDVVVFECFSCFPSALQQNRAQSRLLYLFYNK